ncbi:MAG: hypothetical protein ABF893_01590 [Gluconacetobacter liquefaciens]
MRCAIMQWEASSGRCVNHSGPPPTDRRSRELRCRARHAAMLGTAMSVVTPLPSLTLAHDALKGATVG